MPPLSSIGDIATLADVIDITESAAADILLAPAAAESVAAVETATPPIALSPAATAQVGVNEAATPPIGLTPAVAETLPSAADESQAQMLASVGHPATIIEREAAVSASRAQMYDQIHG